jgi:hypothetical protein
VAIFIKTYRKILDVTRKGVDVTSEKIEFGIHKIEDLIIEPDSEYYKQAEQEINDGTVDKGLWAKALVKSKGNEQLRKPEYIKLRAKQLQRLNAEQLRREKGSKGFETSSRQTSSLSPGGFTFGNQQEPDLTLFVDNKLIFKDQQTGRIKKIKVGFTFLGFFFTWIVLFVKGLPGRALLVLCIEFPVSIGFAILKDIYIYSERDTEIINALIFTGLGLLLIKIIIGIYANKWQAEALLKRGWILQNADAAKDVLRAENWRLK